MKEISRIWGVEKDTMASTAINGVKEGFSSPLAGTASAAESKALSEAPVTLLEARRQGHIRELFAAALSHSREDEMLTLVVVWKGANYAVHSNLPEAGLVTVGMVGTLFASPHAAEGDQDYYTCEAIVDVSPLPNGEPVDLRSVSCGTRGGGFPLVDLTFRLLRLANVKQVTLTDMSSSSRNGVLTAVSNVLCKKKSETWWDQTLRRLQSDGVLKTVPNVYERGRLSQGMREWEVWGERPADPAVRDVIAKFFGATINVLDEKVSPDQQTMADLFCALTRTQCMGSVLQAVFNAAPPESRPPQHWRSITQELKVELVPLPAPPLEVGAGASGGGKRRFVDE